MKDKLKGFSVLEVLISAGIFTIVILGISQTVLLMHRYARGNLCQMQAHLLATSYFEQLLCHTHPLELNGKTGSVALLNLNPMDSNQTITTHLFYFNVKNSTSSTPQTDPAINTFDLQLIEGEDTMTVYLQVVVQESPMYEYYIDKKTEKDLSREEINPPEGFQSVRMKYWWTSPFATTTSKKPTDDNGNINIEYLATLPSSELYAIRPILPDEPDYEG